MTATPAHTAASRSAINSLVELAGALASHLEVRDDAELAVMEAACAKLAVIHLETLARVRSGVMGPDFTREDAGLILRITVLASSFLDLLSSGHIMTEAGHCWGRHLINPADHKDISFPSVVRPHGNWVKLLVSHQCRDIMEAAGELLDTLSDEPDKVVDGWRAAIGDSVARIAAAFDTEIAVALAIKTWTQAQVLRELRITMGTMKRRRMISVRTWSGETRYPSLQFFDREVRSIVRYILANTEDAQFNGWPLAVLLHQYREKLDAGGGEAESFFRGILEDAGLWKPAYTRSRMGDLAHVRDRPDAVVRSGKRRYRITREEHAPFWFQHFNGEGPSGRYDLALPGQGTCYLADSAVGAWTEVLERMPVLRLGDVVGRRLWVLKPQSDLAVKNLTGGVDEKLTTTPYRAETRDVAERLRAAGANGVAYRLRTGQNRHRGLALFGPEGLTPPSAAGLGIWSARSNSGVEAESFGKYLRARLGEGRFPVILRRFPDEVDWDRRR
jgi:hypothetical protein